MTGIAKDRINSLIMEYQQTQDDNLRDQVWSQCRDYLWGVYRKTGFTGLDDDVEILGWHSFEQTLECFDPKRDFLGFLALVFVRRCIDAMRIEKRRRDTEILESELRPIGESEQNESKVAARFEFSVDAGPDRVVEAREALSQIREAVTEMSDLSRQAVEMGGDGLSYAAIQRLLKTGRPVKDLIYHNRQKAKRFLRKRHGWEI